MTSKLNGEGGDWRRDIGLIVGAATLAPATLAAGNAVFGPDILKLTAIVLAQILGGLIAVTIGKWFGLRHRVAVTMSAVLLLAFTLGGGFVRSLNLELVALACVGVAIILVLAARWSRDDRSWTWLGNTAWLMVIIMIGRAAFTVLANTPSSPSQVSPDHTVGADASTQSFYLIVLDGYPGAFSELPELTSVVEEFVKELADRGFHRTNNARANYNTTFASISSALSLEHDLSHSESGIVEALERIRGNNRLVRDAKHAGYRYVHIESGWSGSTCGRSVDLCYKGLLIDETVEALSDLSVLGMFWKQSASVGGALNALDNLSAHIADDDGGDFVFAHVLLPHPPLQLQSDCARTYKPELDVGFLNSPKTTESELLLIKAGFLQQIQCVNKLVLGLVDQLPRGWPVVLTSDHGTDFRGQLLKTPDHWDERDIEERFSNFNVTRLPESCPVGQSSDLVNIMRSAASCVLGVALRPITPRYQIVPYNGFFQPGARVLTESEMGF